MSRAGPRRALAVAALAGVLVLAGCAASRPASPTGDHEMAPGARVRLADGSSLAYTRVRHDSRCPPEVACIHAGWAEAEFVHAAGAAPGRTFVLSTRAGGEAFETGGWRFELHELGRGASPPAAIRITRAAD
jgi:nitrogen fixation protein